MNTPHLGQLAALTLRNPAEAARTLLALKPGRELLWLAFSLAVVLNCLIQFGIDLAVPVAAGQTAPPPDGIALLLARSAGTMMFSILAFLFLGKVLGGTAKFEDMMVLIVWLQYLQIAALLGTLVLSLAVPFVMVLLILATAVLSFYITLHFLNEAHQFRSLWKSFGVVLLSALVAVPFVLMLAPAVPV